MSEKNLQLKKREIWRDRTVWHKKSPVPHGAVSHLPDPNPGPVRPRITPPDTPSRITCLCLCRGAPGGCQQNAATNCLTNSHRKTTINSGRITVFFRSIASAKKGGEAKLVQPGILRARISYPVNGGKKGVYDGTVFAPPCSRAATPARYPRVCPDSSRFPSRSTSTSDEGMTWKNRHVP